MDDGAPRGLSAGVAAINLASVTPAADREQPAAAGTHHKPMLVHALVGAGLLAPSA
jgi:hypothetical protein